ncbi:tetratricopeptide repeat protein [Marinilabilia sp.]|uniref:type IX secretion system periplasmic lipoprotein PorW/SprE n=1 Tax=Marinilabilia sp. TaxID=2021252 RepID=UPI0025BBC534|nr:tetratricopeptide repeat protein [Marinilabilia sp.]
MKKISIIFLLVLLVSFGCSTQKNTWLSRGYHNLTARYNVLFNGQQSFDRGQDKMRESVTNDYTKVLPVFAFSENSGGQVSSSDMNRAIRKAYKLIEKHSITVKPSRSARGATEEYRAFYNQREFNRWVDDAYMLMGKSHIYSREWYEAIGAFNMVLQLFPEKSVRFEAMLWIARAYIEMGDLQNARLSLERYSSGVENEKQFFPAASATYAWFWLMQDDYENAVEYCRLAAENATDRWQKIRWFFILGQVAEKLDRSELAYDAYQKVVAMNPDYEMVIYARVKNALLSGGPDNSAKSREILKKYAREYKNLDYRDQIFFSIAETHFWEGDTLNALVNLQLAAGYGDRNRILAGNIYQRMADIYFQSGDYVAADAYYDSTLTALPQNYPGVSEIQQFRRKLTPLAESLRTISHEDSVQRIAALSEEERAQFIDNLLASMQEQEEQEQFGGQMDDAFFYRNFANRGNKSTDETGKWYFYNQTMISLGQMEFEKRWGRRELEDNWRRKNKKAQIQQQDLGANDGMMPADPFSQEPPGPVAETEMREEAGKPDRQALISGLPLTPEEMEISQLKVQKALFNAGHLLAQNFEKHSEAIDRFEELISQYPQTGFREQALMGIYLSCAEIPDRPCLSHYGQVIQDDFPDSRFAAFVEDPDYFEKKEAQEQVLDTLYAEAFRDFKEGFWNRTLDNTSTILKSGYEDIMPQAMLLNAAAYSQTGNRNAFRNGLLALTDAYPRSSQADVARHWLEMLKQGHDPEKDLLNTSVAERSELWEAGDASQSEDETGKYVFQPEEVHYLLIALQPDADVNQILFYLANFNFDRYTVGGLQLESGTVEAAYNTLQTGPFNNSRVGLDYFFALLNNPSVFAVTNPGRPLLLLISEDNYGKLKSASDLEEYRQFFLEKYLPGSDPSAIIITESEIPEEPYVRE